MPVPSVGGGDGRGCHEVKVFGVVCRAACQSRIAVIPESPVRLSRHMLPGARSGNGLRASVDISGGLSNDWQCSPARAQLPRNEKELQKAIAFAIRRA